MNYICTNATGTQHFLYARIALWNTKCFTPVKL